MKKNLLVLATAILGLVAASSAFADDMDMSTTNSGFQPGFYIGGQIGLSRADEGNGIKDLIDYSYNGMKPFFTSISKDIDQGGLGGRAFIGYSINPYLSIEGGYTHYANNTYKFHAHGYLPEPVTAGAFDPDSVNIDLKLESYSADLMAKASFPLYNINQYSSGFSLYGKLGVAYMHNKFSGYIDDEDVHQTNTAWRPAYGVGIAYNFDQSLALDLSWSQVLGKDKIKLVKHAWSSYLTNPDNAIADGDLLALGVTFKFVNV